MLKPLFVASVLLVAPPLAMAADLVNVQSTVCSGTETVSGTSTLALSCSGDFSFSGGVLSADTSITLSALGALSLDNITVTAPDIQFIAGTSITLGNLASLVGTNVSFAAASFGQMPTVSVGSGATLTSSVGSPPTQIVVGGGSLTISPGGSANLNGGTLTLSPVPEPGPWAMLLAGLACIAVARRFRRTALAA